MLASLLHTFRTNPEVVETGRALKRGIAQQFLTGIGGTQKTALAASLWDGDRTWVYLTHGSAQAARVCDDLASLLGEDRVLLFPDLDTLPHEETSAPEVQGQRACVLSRLSAGEKLIVVTHAGALARKVVPAAFLADSLLRLQVGKTVPLEDVIDRAVRLGYERVDLVEGQGQFARRGGILDIWPPTVDVPGRIEFFGDDVDSIRRFDPVGQRSLENQRELAVWPVRDTLLGHNTAAAVLAIRKSIAAQAAALRKSGLEEAADRLEQHMGEQIERLEQLGHFPGQDQFMPFFHDSLATLLDYAPDALIILDEPVRVQEYGQAGERQVVDDIMGHIEGGQVLREEMQLFVGYDELMNRVFVHDVVALAMLPRAIRHQRPGRTAAIPVRSAHVFQGKPDRLIEDVRRWQKDRVAVLLVVNEESQGKRLAEVLREGGIEVVWDQTGSAPLSGGSVVVTRGNLESGFECTEPRLVLLTGQEIYGRPQKKRRARFTQEGVKISAYTDLRPGDYVVHVNHGIGQYQGMKTLVVAGVHRDYLQVQYAGADMLYVPVDQVNLLQKYIGTGDDSPRLYKLGGGDWQRVKSKVKESVREMAEGLIKLYAERETVRGIPLMPDSPWQAQFEDAFIYEETPDQNKAIEEIKHDLEGSRPMDRLLCGDVGYGKTEVAIRAAFKTVDNGKQVAVLVPTTILAQQHYQTFADRFAGFPAITIRSLSRFQSAKEQKETVRMLASGQADVVIGTHRLLSSDVKFKDLGLLVVDEEQRFGVSHKERIKELKKNVHVLTLTATPIPRTLHMALVGARDMSVIETPPEDRYPVRTYITEYNDDLVRDAIQRELSRGGQVYFVYNRVESIDQMAGHLQALVPEARILVGHGQMPEDMLERVMLDFLDGEADILLCTTIIESGMDISNVNTLIVHDSDHLGLAQLYQLRGRVGRTNRVAYAYFTYRRDRVISEIAEKRLQAIRDFTELGSGFKIAMRDLEIRGAGNLLGAEQHGHIASVGFEMYCRLLEEAIQESRGEQKPEPPETAIELPLDAYIPEEYIPDARQKVEMYKKIAGIGRLEHADLLQDELTDRFGDPPAPVQNLLSITRLRLRLRTVGVQSVGLERDTLVVRFHEGIAPEAEKVHQLLRQRRARTTYHSGKNVQIRIQRALQETGGVVPLMESVAATLGA